MADKTKTEEKKLKKSMHDRESMNDQYMQSETFYAKKINKDENKIKL